LKERTVKWDCTFERNAMMQGSFATARGQCVLEDMYNQSVHTFEGKLELTLSPQAARTVRANQPITPGELMLVPITNNLVCTKPGELPLNSNVDLGFVYTHQQTGKDVYIYAKHCTQIAEGGKPEMLAPFWFVDTTMDVSKANVTYKLIQSETEEDWYIPCMVNSKSLAKNDTLLVLVRPGKGRYPSFADLEEKADKRLTAKKRRKA
jgi:hypothetical protein